MIDHVSEFTNCNGQKEFDVVYIKGKKTRINSFLENELPETVKAFLSKATPYKWYEATIWGIAN